MTIFRTKLAETSRETKLIEIISLEYPEQIMRSLFVTRATPFTCGLTLRKKSLLTERAGISPSNLTKKACWSVP